MNVTTKFHFSPNGCVTLDSFLENIDDNMNSITKNYLFNFSIQTNPNSAIIAAVMSAITEWFEKQSEKEIELIEIRKDFYTITIDFFIIESLINYDERKEENLVDVMYKDQIVHNFRMSISELVEYISKNEIKQVILL